MAELNPFTGMNEGDAKLDAEKIREMLEEFACAGVSLSDKRMSYCEIQVRPELIRDARKVLGMKPNKRIEFGENQ